ncbi:alkane 1-monooxygenase [Panacagrimonas sp.]|uniref:alkane 1-monooxygenase n=1 Tax=Panacagrimonas sp. TaxID=2480088 RepID=UPI003B52F739
MTTLANPHTAHWIDARKPWWALGMLVPLLPFICYALVQITGSGTMWWFGPVFLYGIVPLLDGWIGDDCSNPPEAVVAELEQQRWYRWVTYAFVPLQYAATVLGVWLATSGNLAWWELLGLGATVGIVNGVGINTAHELGHKTGAVERWLAKIALAPVAYGHFFIEHNRGHHVRAATPEDPASARMGESFWAFLPRTVVGSIRSAWHLEAQRLGRGGKPVWHWQNHNLQAWAMTVLLFGSLTAWLGWGALLFLVLQAAYGASLLEAVNYLEHYGLKRAKDSSGRYERVQPKHSWNNNRVVTNLLLYQLQRHSDHHANPTRRYQALRHFDESPQLPAGYATLIPLVYFPPLWYRLMDRHVAAYHHGDLGKANLQPSQRARLLACYGSQPQETGG